LTRLAGPSHRGRFSLLKIHPWWYPLVVKQSIHPIIPPSNDELVGQVASAIAQFQNATAVVDAAAADFLGLHATDLRCMGRLYAAGALTAGALADACGLSRGAMTAALDRLEGAGYVRRVRGDTDRRRVRVEVTPRALELTEAIWGPIGGEGIEQLMRMTGEELTFLRDFLRRGRELQERHARRIAAMGVSHSELSEGTSHPSA
jgi:DNA-binding MarR family transcriptional regulator